MVLDVMAACPEQALAGIGANNHRLLALGRAVDQGREPARATGLHAGKTTAFGQICHDFSQRRAGKRSIGQGRCAALQQNSALRADPDRRSTGAAAEDTRVGESINPGGLARVWVQHQNTVASRHQERTARSLKRRAVQYQILEAALDKLPLQRAAVQTDTLGIGAVCLLPPAPDRIRAVELSARACGLHAVTARPELALATREIKTQPPLFIARRQIPLQ